MHRIGTPLRAAALGLALLAAAPALAAGDAAQQEAARKEAAHQEAVRQEAAREEAIARLVENRASYEKAQQRLAELEAQYTRGRASHELIGSERAKVVQGMVEAKREMAAARAAHPGLFEAARRSGVSWSILDQYEELPAAAPPARAESRQPD